MPPQPFPYAQDIFAADASTCRPYLIHGIVECVKAAQAGGAGLVVYSRQEGNALGEVAKFLVHNARKKLGDSVPDFPFDLPVLAQFTGADPSLPK